MSNKQTLFNHLILECSDRTSVPTDRFKTIEALLPGPYVNGMEKETKVPIVYHASMHPQLLKLLLDHGATLSTQRYGEKNLAIHQWRLHRWRSDVLTHIEPMSTQLTDGFIQSIILIAQNSHINFGEGKKDEKGNRTLSFLHTLFWVAPSDASGAHALASLIEAGIPLCQDLIGDSRLVKDKPQMKSVIENAVLQIAVSDIPTKPSTRKLM